jgi:hypothetical protein
MAAFASGPPSGTAFAEISTVDAAFSKQSGYTQDLILGSTGAYVICNSNVNIGVYQHSATPPSADYAVRATLEKLAGTATNRAGVCGRMASGADTFYYLLYSHDLTNLRLFKRVAGSQTQLGSSYTVTISTPQEVELQMDGDQISGWLDGVQVIGPVTDTDITSAGKSGMYAFHTREAGVADGLSLSGWEAEELGGASSFIPIIGRGPGMALAGHSGLVG